MAEAQNVEMEQLVVDEQQIIARSWTGAICKGTWGCNPVLVRFISITDIRENFMTHFSPTFVHENVLRVYWHAICPRQIHRYFVLEHFDLTLTQYCRQVPESVEVIPRDIDALRQMVDGLLFIHGKGFIHGAINPDNILICVHNEQIILKISDFGLHVNQTASENRVRFQHCHPIYWTISDQHNINLNFSGPEDGPSRIDIEESFYNDIFGMGCTLFYFLKHIHPFLDCDSHNTYQVVLNIQEGNPTRLQMLGGHVALEPIKIMIAIKPPIDGRPNLLIASSIFRDYLTTHPCCGLPLIGYVKEMDKI